MARGKDDPVAAALGTVELFKELSPKELKVLAGLTKEYRFTPGQEIVTEGDTSARFYIITEGTAEVVRKGKVAAKIGPGDYFGEMAVLDRLPRSASVIASAPVTTYSLASFSLRPVLKEHPDIMLKLLVRLSQRVREAEAKLSH